MGIRRIPLFYSPFYLWGSGIFLKKENGGLNRGFPLLTRTFEFLSLLYTFILSRLIFSGLDNIRKLRIVHSLGFYLRWVYSHLYTALNKYVTDGPVRYRVRKMAYRPFRKLAQRLFGRVTSGCKRM